MKTSGMLTNYIRKRHTLDLKHPNEMTFAIRRPLKHPISKWLIKTAKREGVPVARILEAIILKEMEANQ